VISTSPADDAVDVAASRVVHVYFSEALDPASVDAASFHLADGGTDVAGSVSVDGAIATFTPAADLSAGHTYDAVVTIDVLDVAGNPLAADEAWSFTVGDAIGGRDGVDLQSAFDFAVLAGSTVTSTDFTVITGDIGISAGTALTGFPPAVLHGAVHAGDPAAAQAELDLTEAYNDAAGRANARVTVAGNLGGQTLAPGLYTSDSSLAVSSGDLTLDAGGDADAVWVFQMASTFTMTSGRQVFLTGNAKAANVYWQVGSSATLGSTSVMVGNLLADQSITLETGATLDGRALTRIGAVTLDANVITLPMP
jgi:hypothetical protein